MTKEEAIELVKNDGTELKKLEAKFINDREIVLLAISSQNTYYEWVPDVVKFVFENTNDFINDREIVLAAVKKWGLILELVSMELRDDKGVVLEAYCENSFSFKYASEKLKNDKDFILTIFNQKDGYHVLDFISEELKKDSDFEYQYRLAAKEGKIPYRFLPADFKNNREQVLNSFKNENEYCDHVFDNMPEEFKNDKEIILAALTPKGYLSLTWFKFQSVSEILKNDREVVLSAIKKDGNALKFASDILNNDRDIVWEAICNGCSLEYVSENFRDDKQIVITAIEKKGLGTHQISFASERLKNDRDVALLAVSKCGRDLEYVSFSLKNDKEVVLTAVNEYGEALKFASDEMKNDLTIIKLAVNKDARAIEFVPENMRDLVHNNIAFSDFKLNINETNQINIFESKKYKLQVRNKFHQNSWYGAIKIAQNLGLGWRLPSVSEMQIIYNELHKKNVLSFYEDDFYWTSESVRPERAVYFDFVNGVAEAAWNKALKADSHYVFFVRSI